MKPLTRRPNSTALRRSLTMILLAILSGLATVGSGAPSIAGRLALTEQRFGSGHGNLPPPDAPVRLEFVASQGRLVGRIWSGSDPAKALPWPALPSERGPRPIQIREQRAPIGGDQARAVYRVRVG